MKRPYRIVHDTSTASSRELADWLAKDGQLLVPLVELLEKGERAIDEVIDVMGRATVEAVLQMSAAQVVGPKAQGRRGPDREVYWHGVQGGRVALKERQLRVARPRLRKKRRRADESGEVSRETSRRGRGFYRSWPNGTWANWTYWWSTSTGSCSGTTTCWPRWASMRPAASTCWGAPGKLAEDGR